jgi:hypothetical protein
MRIRITSMPARQGRFAERLAVVVLVFAIVLSVAGVAVEKFRVRTPPQSPSVVQSTNPSPVAVPAPAPIPAKPPEIAPEGDLHATGSREVKPVVETPPKPSKLSVKTGVAPAPRKDNAPKGGFQLRGAGAVVMLAYEEAAAAQLRSDPRLVGDLVRRGLLFSVPVHTEVAIVEKRQGLVQVRIIGRTTGAILGWVQPDQVMAK